MKVVVKGPRRLGRGRDVGVGVGVGVGWEADDCGGEEAEGRDWRLWSVGRGVIVCMCVLESRLESVLLVWCRGS